MDEIRRTDRPHWLRPVSDLPPSSGSEDWPEWPSSAAGPDERIEMALDAFFASVVGATRDQWPNRVVLAHALRRLGGRDASVDYVSPYTLHLVFGSEPPDEAGVAAGSWMVLPDLLSAYVRFLRHVSHRPDDVLTLAALDEIDMWEPSWRHTVEQLLWRRRSRRPRWQHELDLHATVVGGHEMLPLVDTFPLPDEPLLLLTAEGPVAARAGEVASHCDRYFDHLIELFGTMARVDSSGAFQAAVDRQVELRTAARRLVARLAQFAPATLAGRARPESLAVAVCWAVTSANTTRRSTRASVVEIAETIGGSRSGTTDRARSMLESLGVAQLPIEADRPRARRPSVCLGTPELLTSDRRSALLSRVGQLECWLADPDEP